MPGYIEIPAEKLAEARAMYEEGEMTVVEIAAFLGVSKPTFHNRLRSMNWRRRRRAPPAERAGLAADRTWADGFGTPAPEPTELDRLAITAETLRILTQARWELAEYDAREREIAREREREQVEASGDDMEAMRRELVRRMAALAAARDAG